MVDRCVVDDEVQPLEMLDNALDCLEDSLLVAHIARHRDALDIEVDQIAAYPRYGFLVDVDTGHRATGLRQRSRGCLAKPAAGSGYQGDLAF